MPINSFGDPEWIYDDLNYSVGDLVRFKDNEKEFPYYKDDFAIVLKIYDSLTVGKSNTFVQLYWQSDCSMSDGIYAGRFKKVE